MINASSRAAVDGATWRGPLIRPLYDSYCFANLPSAIERRLTGKGQTNLPPDTLAGLPERCDTVILFFIDAFGWRFFQRYRERYPFLRHFIDNGVVSTLTSMFPSTTAAHVTAIHTGFTPGQSGVYEWYQYEPTLDATILPLPFCLPTDKTRDTLSALGFAADKFFPATNIHQRLGAAGVDTFVVQPDHYSRDATGQALHGKAHALDYKTLPEALVRLGEMLARQRGPAYYFLYYSDIDTLAHGYGPESDAVDAQADQFLITLERNFERLLGKRKDAIFILTADHGQVEVNPKTCIYMNEKLPGSKRWMRTHASGETIWPSGSARDTFWHVRPDALDEATAAFRDLLKDKAVVVQTSELIEAGFFGPSVSQAFLSRVGNLTVLPFAGESVWWKVPGRLEQRFFGHHGGLTRQEMEIPMLACRL